MDLAQFTHADACGGRVDASGRLTLRAKVLGDGIDTRFAQRFDDGACHLRGEIGILAEAFLAPSPTGIAEDVEHRNEGEVNAGCVHLLAANAEGVLDKGRGKARGACEVNGQEIAVERLVPVRTFGGKEHGNAEKGMGNDALLNAVARADGKASLKPRGKVLLRPRVGTEYAVDRADATVFFYFTVQIGGKRYVVAVAGIAMKSVEGLGKLTDFFAHVHAGKQVGEALLYGERCVLIWIHMYSPAQRFYERMSSSASSAESTTAMHWHFSNTARLW